jgi:hypothetical protein
MARLFLYNFASILWAIESKKVNYLISNLLFFATSIWFVSQSISSFITSNSPLDFFWYISLFSGIFAFQIFINSHKDLLIKSFCILVGYSFLWLIINLKLDSLILFNFLSITTLAIEIGFTYSVVKSKNLTNF